MNQEIFEGNKIIAQSPFSKQGLKNTIANDTICFSEGFAYSGIRFHDSFDWQMSIVEEIEKGNYGFKMCRTVVEIYYDDTKEVILKIKGASRKKSLFKALVQFILFHNTHITEANK